MPPMSAGSVPSSARFAAGRARSITSVPSGATRRVVKPVAFTMDSAFSAPTSAVSPATLSTEFSGTQPNTASISTPSILMRHRLHREFITIPHIAEIHIAVGKNLPDRLEFPALRIHDAAAFAV